jgi:hypothetical protein
VAIKEVRSNREKQQRRGQGAGNSLASLIFDSHKGRKAGAENAKKEL